MIEDFELSELEQEIKNCLICGTDVSEMYVQCVECHDAYHLECWDYVGSKCAKYGCGSKEYDIVKEGNNFSIHAEHPLLNLLDNNPLIYYLTEAGASVALSVGVVASLYGSLLLGFY